jgi:hypothetical protein
VLKSYDRRASNGSRAARFFWVQRTKTGENVPNDQKYQMAVK